ALLAGPQQFDELARRLQRAQRGCGMLYGGCSGGRAFFDLGRHGVPFVGENACALWRLQVAGKPHSSPPGHSPIGPCRRAGARFPYQAPPRALRRRTLAATRRLCTSRAARWLESAAVCACTTCRKVMMPARYWLSEMSSASCAALTASPCTAASSSRTRSAARLSSTSLNAVSTVPR